MALGEEAEWRESVCIRVCMGGGLVLIIFTKKKREEKKKKKTSSLNAPVNLIDPNPPNELGSWRERGAMRWMGFLKRGKQEEKVTKKVFKAAVTRTCWGEHENVTPAGTASPRWIDEQRRQTDRLTDRWSI